MKFTKCVIGPDYKPVGFVYVENGREFYEDFASLCRKNAHDGNLYFSESGVFGLYKNSENSIDICRETVGGGYSDPIDPSIKLVERIISGGQVVGFVVEDSTGARVKKHISSIISAAKYMKPANFMIVEVNGKLYPRGKGCKLSELPAIDITPGMKTPAKPKTVKTEPYDAVDPRHSVGASIAFLAKQVEDCDGVFLKLPEDKYKPVGEKIVKDNTDFTRLASACEIAYPSIEAASKKLSASLQFKVPGSVLTSEGATLAYIYRKKNIVNIHYVNNVLRGDKVRLGRVVIVIPKQNEQKFYSAIAGTIAVEAMAGTPEAIATAMKLVKIQDPVFLSVDLTNISLLGYEYEKYLMAGAEIKAAIDAITKAKYAVGLAKKYKEGLEIQYPASAGGRKVWDIYSRFSNDALNELTTMGVDVATGIYNEPYSARQTEVNTEAITKAQDIEIEYVTDLKLTVPKDALAVLQMTPADLPAGAKGLGLEDLLSADGSIPAKKKQAEAIIEKFTGQRKRLERRLFFHKVAMIMDGNNTVHAHDRDEWKSASVRANAQFVKYTHDSGVSVKLRNIDMSKK